jgi:hypothetical protein
MELCFEASEVAATLATARSQAVFDTAHARFLALFWGPLSIVENRAVSARMVEFRRQLNRQLAKNVSLPLDSLEGHSYELAIEIKRLIRSWKITDIEEKIVRNAA